ncbi:M48 family metallopeptidase [Sphingomonas sp. Mn802worker]|uniref:M48 family metallopeptidase n=1 Tax=Sphingomonas sp. Mn802worker TaxID=629773 RepID=UPI0003627CA5|nr:SprT family zinc-dependent metalloprotease [Sphingomonas sp. Mn802worker]
MSQPIDVVRHPRARRAKLSFDPVTGRVRLTIPKRAALTPLMAWARAQEGWIDAQRAALPQSRPFVPGSIVPFDGAALEIAWRADAPRRVERVGDQLIVGGPSEGVEARVAGWLKRQALALLKADTDYYAARAGVTVTQVGIGDPRARWGSCAAHGAIRYSWRLALAPPEVRRATAAHEVAHRVHMNHSAVFHALVEQLFGRDPTPERQWLRQHGASLHWFGRSAVE